ncbi:hypothetical protein ACFWAY_32200 [Rhodococcus sp. NPDC059968]|uniref:hypothetical protein n=1 Tax=Rhodococcus sp. NPDC059968 TaxID=3347017 RepID=UPI00366D3069
MLGVAIGLGAVAALSIPAITPGTTANRDRDRDRESMLRHPELALVAGVALAGYKSEWGPT